MLGLPGGIIHKNDGTITRGGDLLPSGYFILTQAKTDGKVTGYAVTGGRFCVHHQGVWSWSRHEPERSQTSGGAGKGLSDDS